MMDEMKCRLLSARGISRLAAAFALAAVLALAGCSGAGTGSPSASSASDAATGADEAATSQVDAALSNENAADVASGPGYEWAAIALARGGGDAALAPLAGFSQKMCDHVSQVKGVLDESNVTEYAKAVLALTSVGVNARDVAGYDVVGPLCDAGFAESQGANGPIWALIALSCHPFYAEGEDAQAAREELLALVIGAQGADGGWSFTGEPDDKGDADLTAMALTALSPFCTQDARAEAAEAVERGLEFLSGVQQAEGGFAYMGNESSESAAQVVIALSSLGIDPAADARFVKEGGTPLTNLLTFQDAAGGFAHEAGGEVDALASDQGACALVAAQRQLAGQTALYDMSDVELR